MGIGIKTGIMALAGAGSAFSNVYSLALDGTDDRVTMGDVLDFANDGTQAFSLSAWFKTTDTATQVLIGKQLNTSPFNGYNLSLSSTTIGFFLGTTSGQARIQGLSPTLSSITNGNWHHVAITNFNNDGGKARAFFNGVCKFEVTSIQQIKRVDLSEYLGDPDIPWIQQFKRQESLLTEYIDIVKCNIVRD